MPVFSNNANVSLGPFSTAQQLSSALNRNELSAEELLMATVERIEAVKPRRQRHRRDGRGCRPEGGKGKR